MAAAPRHIFPAVLLLALAALVAVLMTPLPAVAYPPGTPDAIAERIAPIGAVCHADDSECAAGASGAAAGGAELTGESVYTTYCAACHSIGVAGAPIYGDKTQWAPRLATGIDALYNSTFNGIGGMPAGGTCASCDEDNLRDAVDYMVEAVQ